MKKTLLFVTVLLLCAAVFLAACEDTEKDASSAPVNESSAAEGSESSTGGESSTPDESSSAPSQKPTNGFDGSEYAPAADSPITVLHSAYTEKPYFALVGRCAANATVTGVADGETVSSESYEGWFSLRLPCKSDSVKVTLTQTVDGKAVGEETVVTVRPITPNPNDMWPMITGKNYQFFLAKMHHEFAEHTTPPASAYSELSARVRTRLTQLRASKPEAEIIYLLCPSAMTVYPELVPDEYSQPKGSTKLDLTANALRAGGATVIDLKSVFAQHKNDEMPIYYKTDSHWSDYGAYVAYNALFSQIAKKFPEASPRAMDEFDWNPNYYEGGDMAYYLARVGSQGPAMRIKLREYAYFRTFKDTSVPSSITSVPRYQSETLLAYSNDVTYAKTFNTRNENLPSCIVMRDSYSTQIYDLIPERMNKTQYLGMWDYTWNAKSISSSKPDYIIYIVAEWNLDSIIFG